MIDPAGVRAPLVAASAPCGRLLFAIAAIERR